MNSLRSRWLPIVTFLVFEAVAVALWLAKDNIFYLFNFSYIGAAVALGIFLFTKKSPHARRVTQLLVGLYMLDDSRKRENGTECILCLECVKNCPKDAL